MKNEVLSKKIIYPIVFAGLFCMNATRCSNGAAEQDKHPGGKLKPEWSPDMRVSCSYGGGMTAESRHIEINSDSAVYHLRKNGMEGKYRLNLSKAERDALAKVFYDNDFVGIQSTEREGTLYDAPSSSVTICVGTDCWTRGDDAYSVYTGNNAARIKNVSKYVWALGDKKLEEHKMFLAVMIDEVLLREKDDVHYQIAPAGISFNTGTMGRTGRQEYKVLPGKFSVSVYTVAKDSLGSVRYSLQADAVFSMNEGNTVMISKKDGQLHLVFEKR